MPEGLLPIGTEQSFLSTIHASLESRKVIRNNSEAEKLVIPIPTKQILALLIRVHLMGFCKNKILKSNIRYSTKKQRKILMTVNVSNICYKSYNKKQKRGEKDEDIKGWDGSFLRWSLICLCSRDKTFQISLAA